jgi:hypothetical protein
MDLIKIKLYSANKYLNVIYIICISIYRSVFNLMCLDGCEIMEENDAILNFKIINLFNNF